MVMSTTDEKFSPEATNSGHTLHENTSDVAVSKDGGKQAWCTVAGGWLVLVCTFGSGNAFGVFNDYYTLAGTSSASNISWIGSLQLFLMFSLGLVSGKLFDMGYFHQVQLVGILLYVFSSFMLSLADYRSYYQVFLAQGVGVGLGCGLLYLPAVAIQGHHWEKRRALAMGIIMTGTSFGGIVYPIMMNQLFHHTNLGFGWSIRIKAFLDMAMLFGAKCLMSTSYPPGATAKTSKISSLTTLRRILTDAPYMITVAGAFFIFWGLFFPAFYLQLIMDLKHLSPTLAFYTVSIINVSSAPARPIPGLLADKYGAFNLLAIFGTCTGALTFVMFAISNDAGVIAFAILFGFFGGGVASLLPPTMAALSRDVSEIGVRMGVCFFVIGFANLTGTPIDGALMKTDDDWYIPLIFTAVTILTGSGLIVIARQMLVRRRGTNLL